MGRKSSQHPPYHTSDTLLREESGSELGRLSRSQKPDNLQQKLQQLGTHRGEKAAEGRDVAWALFPYHTQDIKCP